MKRKLLTILAASAFVFASCDKDDDNGNNDGQQVELTSLSGAITTDAIVKGNTINLAAATIVREGATLTIPAGTKIVAKSSGAYLLIERGAKIIAKGTAASPITFTSDNAKSGAWGGLILNGKAPLSRANVNDPSNFGTEINDQIFYGGNDVADNSGELDYIILEYTGSNIADDKEHNGLTLNGVGNGTKISNIYIKDGADDAIEFFGGSVNVTNLLVVNSEDDMFDFTQGYSGTLKNAYGVWEAGFTTNEGDPRGVEADGNHDGKGDTHIGQSNFKMQDITIVQNSTTAGVAGTMQDVIKIRRLATATITNLLIKIGATSNFDDIIDLSGDAKQAGNAASSITYSFNPESKYDVAKVKANGATVTKNTTSTGANTSVFAWTKYTF